MRITYIIFGIVVSMSVKVKLNLGCGSDIREGWQNYDKYPQSDKVKFLDLDVLPLPFPGDYADVIKLSQVLEHILYPLDVCLECQRILKKGGRLLIDVPVYSFTMAHRRPVNTIGSFDLLWQDTPIPEYSGDAGFILVRKYGDRRGESLVRVFVFRVLQQTRDFIQRLFYHHFVWEFKKR